MISAIYFTPASISYLNQSILAVMIVFYFTWRLWSGTRPIPRLDVWMYFFSVTVSFFSILQFLEASQLPTLRPYPLIFTSAFLGILVFVAFLFALEFIPVPRISRQQRTLALLISGAYMVTEFGVAAWRLIELGEGRLPFRPALLNITSILLFLGLIFIFLRGRSKTRYLPSSRPFALVFLIPLWLVILNYLRTIFPIPNIIFHMNVSIGMLFAIFLFSLAYVTIQPQVTTFMAKLSGVVLTSALAVFGVIAWIITPSYADQFQPEVQDQVTLTFTPASGSEQVGEGYYAMVGPLEFEDDFGENIGLTNSKSSDDAYPVAFDFPFGGHIYREIYILEDGVIGLGAAPDPVSIQNQYGKIPLIMPLLVDLNPLNDRNRGVFLRQEADRLVITFHQVPASFQPDAIFTFQLTLYSSGRFTFSYAGLPDNLLYYPNDYPEASLWAIGYRTAELTRVSTNLFKDAQAEFPGALLPASGAVQDEYRSFRTFLDGFLRPLAVATLVISMLFAVGLPSILYLSFASPLRELLHGVREMQQKRTGLTIPIRSNDEIGYLTQSFNSLSQELFDLIEALEERVETRTAALAEANEQLRKLSTAVEQSPSAIVITDEKAQIEYVNHAFTVSTGYTLDEVTGKNARILKSGLTPPETYQQMWDTLRAGKPWGGELCNRKKNGEIIWESTLITPIYQGDETSGGRKVTHYAAIKEDVTLRRQADQALLESEQQYRDLFEMESDAIFIVRNKDGLILEANTAASTLYGYTHNELLQMKNTQLSAEPDYTQAATLSPAPVHQVVTIPLRWHKKNDGTRFPVEITARFFTWRNQQVHIAAVRDNTERYKIQEELERLAIRDPLTGLYNRRYFFNEGGRDFSRSNQLPYEMAAIMLDIDHFKAINDANGHQVGDVVLCEVAQRMEEALRPTDMLARFGGEEFVVLLQRTTLEEGCQVAERIMLSLNQTPVVVDGIEISVTLSIGIAGLDETTGTFDELIRRADYAMYAAKDAGRNCWVVW